MGIMEQLWEDFEEPDGVRAQLLAGRITMQANPTTLHDAVVRSIVRQVGGAFEAWGERGIHLRPDSRPRADVAVVRAEDVPLEARDWPAAIVCVVVEVVSGGRGAWRDDWHAKREEYAAAGIPVYLIIDPRDGTWHELRLDRAAGAYAEVAEGAFGQPISLKKLDEAHETVEISTLGWHPYPKETS